VTSTFQRIRHSPPVNWLRYHFYLTVLAFPRRRVCNLCGWTGSSFLTYLHKRVLCPRCGSQIRHRLIAAALEHAPERTLGARIDQARILHFSAEFCLESRFKPRASLYVASGFGAGERADVRADATLMPYCSHSFDLIIACDVLEHIVEDRTVIREIWRMLRPGGVAILTVPTFDGLEPTFEDPAIASPEARHLAYGQRDHVRNYGIDFADRLRDVGFTVSSVDASTFEPALVRRCVLLPPESLTRPSGWNNRRVFFAQRSEAIRDVTLDRRLC
jgi:SAM-dependent methyltransferase